MSAQVAARKRIDDDEAFLETMNESITNRLERWSIFCGDGMAMVIFSQWWNGDGFWKFLTITIDGFWWDQPLLDNNGFSMVFSNGSRWLQTEICDKKSAQLKMKTEMQAKDLFHRKSLIVSISLGIVLSTIYFV